jgi:hypothetical protein
VLTVLSCARRKRDLLGVKRDIVVNVDDFSFVLTYNFGPRSDENSQ